MQAPCDKLNYHNAFAQLNAIKQWWLKHSYDQQYGGFIGEIDYYGKPVPAANKGIILNSRILWFFSEVALFCDDSDARAAANRAYHYLRSCFDDPVYGGVVWELDHRGTVVNGRKQVYAHCFSIYGLVAYYRLTRDLQALALAQNYFALIETYARDDNYGGYIDALSRQWSSIDDFRLSDKEPNTSKTMNTHLHIIEAYTALMQVSPDKPIKSALSHVVEIFFEKIVDHNHYHVKLFFNDRWHSIDAPWSYGHDIEASWLLWESLQTLQNPALIKKYRPAVIKLAETCRLEALTDNGQVREGFDPVNAISLDDSVWWIQAEALAGFLNVYQLTGDKQYLDSCDAVWQHIRQHHLDTRAGEWHWLACNREQQSDNNYKLGFWKAPYHNGRAMMQVCQRLKHECNR